MKKSILFAVLFLSLNSYSQCWKEISAGYQHTLAIKQDGTLWAWGKNTNSQLGDGTTVNKSVPTQIGAANNWVSVSGSWTHSAGIKADGTLWVWGYSNFATTGTPALVTLSTPTQLGTDSNWSSVYTSSGSTFAIKTNGTLWSWGNDNFGKLGKGTSGNPNIVSQVGTATWISISGGDNHTVGIQTNGTLWVWGSGADGKLGLSSFTNYSVPTQVGSETNWSKVSAGTDHTIAIKTNGTLWAWGKNDVGQLGSGSLASPIIIPIQIGVETTWSTIESGDYHNLAIKTNGTLWAWGNNFGGQLGNGNTTLSASPIQVGTLVNWSKISAGFQHSLGFKTDNSLNAWGFNIDGRLGDGTTTNRLTPTLVNGLGVTPTFATVNPICSGATLAALPTTSQNGITGTWSPALNNTATTTYTFTPTAGQCATTQTLTITVNSNVTPTFATVNPICSGAILAALPTTSTNGIIGTWSLALNNTTTTTYTFTPTAGQCASTVTRTITVNPNVTPTFAAIAPICSGSTLAAFPTTSQNGITGTWSPALNNTVTTTYIFTPSSGQCATTATMTVVVNTVATPTGQSTQSFTSGATVANLVVNPSIVGWYPSLNDALTDQSLLFLSTPLVNGATYYAVNSVNFCRSAPFGVTVIVTGPSVTVPTISSISTTPNTNAASVTFSVNANNGATNSLVRYGISATNLSNQVIGFTTSGNTIIPGTVGIVGLQPNTQYFYLVEATNSAGTIQSPVLNFTTQSTQPVINAIAEYNFNSTLNNINGNTPFSAFGLINYVADRNGNANSALSMENAPRSASISNFPIGNSARTVSIWIRPTTIVTGFDYQVFRYGNQTTNNTYGFSYTSSAINNFGWANDLTGNFVLQANAWQHIVCTYNAGQATVYVNGIVALTGSKPTWNTILSDFNLRSFAGHVDDLKIYDFALSAQQVTSLYTSNTLNPSVTPNFTQVTSICSGATLAALPTTSTNNITGSWSPAINNTTTTTYTFTPNVGQNATTTTMTIVVNPNVTPTFATVSPICSGATLAALPTTSTNGITGTWSAALNNTATTTYTFTPTAGQCATTHTLTITVNPNVTPTFATIAPICSGATLAALPTTSTNGITGTWSPALNNTATTTYTFTPTAGQCAATQTLAITVNQVATPTGNANQTFVQGATIASLVVSPTNVTWFASLANAISNTNPLQTSQLLVNGTAYFAIATSETCRSTAFTVTVSVTLGLNENAIKYLKIYPNPVNDILNIDTDTEIKSVEIYNLLGQKVKTANSKNINVTDLSNGTYMVRVEDTNNAVETMKIVKQ